MSGNRMTTLLHWTGGRLSLWMFVTLALAGVQRAAAESELISDPATEQEAGAVADGPLPIQASRGSHWLTFRGSPVLLAGDSITQGWMELGEHFDQRAYLDALARRGINAVLLWSYIAITDQETDERIGYDAPEIWPWVREQGRFDLTRFNEVYFSRLREFLDLADKRDIVVVITVHDGWTKTRFSGHPFNLANGGSLQSREEYVDLHDCDREMPPEFDSQWSPRQKHQYYLERFCARLIKAAAGRTNVVFEMFNEGEWYDQDDLVDFQRHFLRFFDARTTLPLAVNDDHVGGSDFRDESELDIISLHMPRWDDTPPARPFFDHFAQQFQLAPVVPVLFTEPVPEYAGDSSRHVGVVRMIWGTALGGAGVLFQNDTSWGFDPRSTLAAKTPERDTVLDFEGHLARFFNKSNVHLEGMRPMGRLSSTGVCLASPRHQYIVYVEGGNRFTVDLSAARGHRFHVRWHNPFTGESTAGGNVLGGSSAEPFAPPLKSDFVLCLTNDTSGN